MILQEILLISITCHWSKSKDFNALIDNKPFIYQPGKANNMHMKTLLKYQQTMTIQRET